MKWNADNLNDGQKTGANGTWLSVGLPPLVIKDRSQIIDLTRIINNEGKLRWKVPPGNWIIIRFVCANTGEKLKVPSPNSNGLATDHFSHEATRVFIQYIIDRLEQKGLVTRTRTSPDRRVITIELTEEGRKVAENAPPPVQLKIVEGLKQLNEQEREQIIQALSKLAEMIDSKELGPAPEQEIR